MQWPAWSADDDDDDDDDDDGDDDDDDDDGDDDGDRDCMMMMMVMMMATEACVWQGARINCEQKNNPSGEGSNSGQQGGCRRGGHLGWGK